jgi:hypothetical protein
MKNIDFLPPRYLERYRQKQALAWVAAVAASFGLLIAGLAAWQGSQRWRANRELASLGAEYQAALAAKAEHEQLQTRLADASQAAELYLYLSHPWPRTQMLRAIETCLPEDTSLTSLSVAYEAQAAPALDEAELQKLTPAQRDLARLRREADHRVAVISISGITSDAPNVYDFASQLGRSPPLTRVTVETAENQSKTKQTTFRLRGYLQPGYCQPGGPEPVADAASVREQATPTLAASATNK